jgi:hypothetical protein
MSTLSIPLSSDSCAAAVDTCANINPGEGRIDRRLPLQPESNLGAPLTRAVRKSFCFDAPAYFKAAWNDGFAPDPADHQGEDGRPIKGKSGQQAPTEPAADGSGLIGPS